MAGCLTVDYYRTPNGAMCGFSINYFAFILTRPKENLY